MTAAIDIGNTRIKIGVFKDFDLYEIIRITDFNELKSILKTRKLNKLIVSSVVKTEEEIKRKFYDLPPFLFLNHNTPLPIKNLYKTPETLGYDRIAALTGAHFMYPSENCLVIDIGTAIKYDFINNKGEFIGGIISPGRAMRYKALHNFTKKLPLLDSNQIPDLVGDSTDSCMHSGVMNGISAEINGIVEKYVKKAKIKIIICGGDAGIFESQINYPTFVNPNLVLEGLNRILYYNVKNI
jgi:type III pantothenate kinase